MRGNAFWRMEWEKLLPFSEKPKKSLIDSIKLVNKISERNDLLVTIAMNTINTNRHCSGVWYIVSNSVFERQVERYYETENDQ